MVVRRMKRRTWFLMAFLVVVLSGCNRQQTADLILTIGFHPDWNRRLAGPKENFATETTANTARQSFEQLVTAMLELQEVRRTDSSGHVDVQQIHGIVDRIHAAAEVLANWSGLTAAERQQVCETELAALNSAAELAPTQFTTLR